MTLQTDNIVAAVDIKVLFIHINYDLPLAIKSYVWTKMPISELQHQDNWMYLQSRNIYNLYYSQVYFVQGK